MKHLSSCPTLRQYVDHYWIVDQGAEVFDNCSPIYAYPGITPEFILVLEGYYRCRYKGKWERVHESRLYSFLEEDILLDPSTLTSFVIVQFKPRALSSILPFIEAKADELMANPIFGVQDAWGSDTVTLEDKLRTATIDERILILDDWLLGLLHDEHSGFIAEVVSELGDGYTIPQVKSLTGYSSSTLERYFKKDTGLTPKRYQSLQRYKKAVREIYRTGNSDWQHYVHTYGYYDQSNFIKEVKRYTTFTPTQLLNTPGILSYRPEP